MGNTVISWRSTKQTFVATSLNHVEVIALHKAVRECVWLRSIIGHIRAVCGLPLSIDEPTCIYEDNVACIEDMKNCFIKGENINHINFKFIYNQHQQSLLNIRVNEVSYEENVADLFTNLVPKSSFEKHVKNIDMLRLSHLTN